MRYRPMRLEGPATVGFAVRKPTERWEGKAGKSFSLVLFARSVGGVGKGVTMTISGDAVARADFTRVECGGATVEFSRDSDGSYVAALEDVELPVGIQFPFDPKPKNDNEKEAAAEALEVTQFELQVHGTAKVAGGDLLSLSMSAIGSSSAPLKWTRPLVIT